MIPTAEDLVGKTVVFYDASCPRCVKDRLRYQWLAGEAGCRNIVWLDITGQESYLKSLGIDPIMALTELHIQNSQGVILSELDAYIMLMKPVFWLKPLAWIIGLPVIRPLLAKLYHQAVERRLRKEGRYPHC